MKLVICSLAAIATFILGMISDQTLLIGAVSGLVGAVVYLFFEIRRQHKAQVAMTKDQINSANAVTKALEGNTQVLQKIHDKIMKTTR